MDRLRRGDEAAAAEVFRRFARRLIGLARDHLDARLRQKLDAEDILQSVLKSFFVRHAAGEYELSNWDSLWSLLAVITLRKCGYRTRYFRAARRDVRREAVPRPGDDESVASWEALASDPTPSDAACLVETVEQLLRGFDNRERAAVELALRGRKAPQISAEIGMAERSVYRVLTRLEARLKRLRAGGEQD
jgi:RNA polymerase sigma-70 factor (ECF subfamily)